MGACYVNRKVKVTIALPEAKENPGFLADYQRTAERTGKKGAEGVLRLKVKGTLKG